MQVLFLKAKPIKNGIGLHQEQRVDKTGRRENRWVKGVEAQPEPRQAHGEDPEDVHGSAHGYGTHNIEHGDKVSFRAAGSAGSGHVVASGKDGATVKDETGKEHSVYWHEVSGHEPAKAQRVSVPPAKVLGKQDRIQADQFKAAEYATSHDQADVTPESVIAQFPPDTKEKIAQANERLKSIEQTIDKYRHDGQWDGERRALHYRVLFEGVTVTGPDGKEKKIPGLLSEEAVRKATPAQGEKPKFVLLGGRGGSGKSSFKGEVYDPEKTIVLDADHVKSMLPEYEGWNAAQVHEESGELFDKAVELARERGLNVVLDKTMKTAKGAIADVKAFKDAGFHTEVHYMHLPRQEAAKRAVGRFLNGGKTGRFVPPEIVLGNTTNEASFDAVRDLVDEWSFRDNNVPEGTKPILISQGGNATPQGKSNEEGDTPLRKSGNGAMLILWKRKSK